MSTHALQGLVDTRYHAAMLGQQGSSEDYRWWPRLPLGCMSSDAKYSIGEATALPPASAWQGRHRSLTYVAALATAASPCVRPLSSSLTSKCSIRMFDAAVIQRLGILGVGLAQIRSIDGRRVGNEYRVHTCLLYIATVRRYGAW